MKILTIKSGDVTSGTQVTKFSLKSAKVDFPAIIVGEDGRGRSTGVLPVSLLPEAYEEWKEKGTVRIEFADLGTTKSGNPRLIQTKTDNSPESFLAVFYTQIGFRGCNDHTGDRTGEYKVDYMNDKIPTFHPFPAIKTIASGTIAQGTAGNMGSGTQLVAVMPYNVVFRTFYGGRLYGNPNAHYYLHDGKELLSLTWEEREISNLF